MPETGSNGSTETLDRSAELEKENKRLAEENKRLKRTLDREKNARAKDKAEADERVGQLTIRLFDMAEKVGKLEKAMKDLEATKQEPAEAGEPKATTASDLKENIDEYGGVPFYVNKDLGPKKTTPDELKENIDTYGGVPSFINPDMVAPRDEEPYVVPPLPPVPPPPAEIPHLVRDEQMSERVLRELQETYSGNLGNLDRAIQSFAISRVERERMFSGGQAKTDIEVMGNELNRVFGVWSESLARMLNEKYKEVLNGAESVTASLNGWNAELNRLGNLPADARPADYDAQVTQAEYGIRYYENWSSAVQQRLLEIQNYRDTIINNQLMSIRTRVDAAMTAERERRHPKLSKVSNWLRTHKKTRMVAGVAMAGLGFVGAATGNVPLFGAAMAGRTALRGLGGYEAVRGAGDWLADRGANKAGYTNVGEYVESGKKQSGRKHRWNRGAAAAGVGLAAAPFIASAIHGTEAAPNSPGNPAAQPNNPNVPRPASPNAPAAPNRPTIPNIPQQPAGPTISPENQEAFARYLGATSKDPNAAANFNKMFTATPDQLAGLKSGVSLEHLSDPSWMNQAGLTSDAAKNQFNYLLGQASTSPEGTQNFINNLPATLAQLRGLNNAV